MNNYCSKIIVSALLTFSSCYATTQETLSQAKVSFRTQNDAAKYSQEDFEGLYYNLEETCNGPNML